MSEELKPCPFCGCDDIRTHLEWSMICANCGAEGSLTDSRADAIAAWNRRAALASTRTAIEAAEMVTAAERMARWLSGLSQSEAMPESWRTTCADLAQAWQGVADTEVNAGAARQGGDTCSTCGDSGIVGYPPDDYFDCPECLAARTQADAGKDAARWRAFRARDEFEDLDFTAFQDQFREDADKIIDDAMLSASAAHSAEGE